MKGILFTADMHKAIREGRKTVTRRLNGLKEINQDPNKWTTCVGAVRIIPPARIGDLIFQHEDGHCELARPRYWVGDIVYIQEAWAIKDCGRYVPLDKETWSEGFPANRLEYMLDNPEKYWWNKRSPLFMPAWAARNFIQITGVSACRTRDITFEDCLAEGIVVCKEWQELAKGDNYKPPEPLHPEDLSNEEADKEIDGGWTEYARQAYFRLYDSINGKGAHERNWDFRYEFNRVAKPAGL